MVRWAIWLIVLTVMFVVNGCGGGGKGGQPPPSGNHPPSVPVLLSPANASTATPTPTFKVKSEDPDGDQVKFEIEVVKGSETKRFETGFFASGSEATFTVPENQALSEGQWSWRAKAIDSKGAASGWSGTWTFTVQVMVDKTPPKISEYQINPTKLRFWGGEVTVSAVVNDPSGVERAWAVVQKPDGTSMEVSLSPAGGDSYRGTVQVGSNTRDDGKSLVYRVWLRARDRKGNETPQPGVPAEGLTVEVTAPLNPPQKPSL
jgi:hypothetical protein